MIHLIPTGSLLLSGLVHLLPLSGVVGAKQLEKLYGIPMNDNANLEIMMRHRAVLFGILGGFHCYAAFRPELYDLAFGSGFASLVSFMALCRMTGNVNKQVDRVFKVDSVVLLALSVGCLVHYLKLDL